MTKPSKSNDKKWPDKGNADKKTVILPRSSSNASNYVVEPENETETQKLTPKNVENQINDGELPVVSSCSEIYSSNEIIDAIIIGDETLELIGYVESVEGPKLVGTEKKFNLLKFILSNGEGRRIQCLAWENQIPKVEKEIQLNNILHCNGIAAKEFTGKKAYNLGNVKMELIVKSHTEIKVLGVHQHRDRPIDKVITWDEIGTVAENETIAICGWIKLPIKATPHKSRESIYGLGCITNKQVKLPVKVFNIRSAVNFERGTSVKCQGVISWDGQMPYLHVANATDISEGGELPINIEELIKITAPPKKKVKLN